MPNNGPFGGLLANLTRVQDARSARVSSYDHSGRNQDYWTIAPGETAVLADLEGPGCITHLWMTQLSGYWQGPNWYVTDPDYYRKVLLRIYWDGQGHPSVLAPLGDLFCLGHSICSNLSSIPFTVSANTGSRGKFGGPCALNCYLQMPLNRRARIELENQGEHPLIQYFYVDYELYREPLGDLGVVPIQPPVAPRPPELNDDMRAAGAAYRRAAAENEEVNARRVADRAEQSRRSSVANVEQALRLRAAFMKRDKEYLP